jgi:Tol biopolymer transport system component
MMKRVYLYMITVIIVAVAALIVFVFAPKPMNTGVAVSRKAGQISFLSERDIYLLDTDTGAITRLTQGARVHRVYWSPDGEYLLFNSRDETKERAPYDLYLLNVSHGELKRLTNDGLGYYGIWSPDGKSIVYGGIGTTALHIIDITGEQRRKLADWASWPDWSPDGKQIAFVSHDDASDAAAEKGTISIINADGTNLRQLGKGWGPAWLPDGKQILYNATSGNDYRLVIMNAEGSNPRTLKTFSKDAGLGVGEWSPDGRFLWFVRTTPDNEARTQWRANLHVIGVDGNNLVDLERIYPLEFIIGPGEDNPHWSPDGKRLLFWRTGGICGFSVDTAATECWASGEASQWSPDGKQIAFHGFDHTKNDWAKHGRKICIYTLHTKTDWLKCYGRDLRDDTYPQWRP